LGVLFVVQVDCVLTDSRRCWRRYGVCRHSSDYYRSVKVGSIMEVWRALMHCLVRCSNHYC